MIFKLQSITFLLYVMPEKEITNLCLLCFRIHVSSLTILEPKIENLIMVIKFNVV